MMSPPPPSNASSKEELRLLWQMSGLAFQFGTEIIAGVLLGWGFDALFGTRPWGVVVGAVAGILVGTADLVRRAIKINRQMDRTNPIRSPGSREAGPGRANRASGATDGQVAGRSSVVGPDERDALDGEFDEALDHDQWKRAQDTKLDLTDDHDAGQHDRPDHGP